MDVSISGRVIRLVDVQQLELKFRARSFTLVADFDIHVLLGRDSDTKHVRIGDGFQKFEHVGRRNASDDFIHRAGVLLEVVRAQSQVDEGRSRGIERCHVDAIGAKIDVNVV